MVDARSSAGLERALASLLDLTRLARNASTAPELEFILVNDTARLLPYRLSALWWAGRGIQALSGLIRPESNAPYAQWAQAVFKHLGRRLANVDTPQDFTSVDLPEDLAIQWGEWWPAHAVWIPLPPGEAVAEKPADGSGAHAPNRKRDSRPSAAAVILVRDEAWSEAERLLLQEWAAAWWHAWAALQRKPKRGLLSAWRTDPGDPGARAGRTVWRRPAWWVAALIAIVCALPIRLTVLAPGELVPRDPVVLRSPLDGVIDLFHVQPNQDVTEGQPLFGFDEALIQTRLTVAQQALATASAEYRQVAQQSLTDPAVRPQLAVLGGRIKERNAEVTFLREQLQRSRVVAPRSGTVLIDDPTQWIGKPVVIGERILRIAAPEDVEVEAWVSIGDAIALPTGTPVRLFLNARPLEPVNAVLRYMGHEAQLRPDGSYAYRIRASLADPTTHRVGLKGTARLEGDRVPVIYWVMRRPIASLRTWLGV